jgi:lantibiotic biosynthesis protein
LYRCVDALLVRAAAHPGGMDLPAWPDVTGSTDRHLEQWRDWLEQVWSRDSIAEAIEVASPVLARQARKMCDEPCRDPREMRRVVMAVARYVLRMTGRATPFGLFAGVAPAGLGPRLTVRWGEEHHPVLRPGAEWLAAMVTGLEACPELLRRLPVVANNLSFVRDGRLVAPDQQHVGDWDDDTGLAVPVEVSVRHTRAVEAVMRYARSPVVAGDLAGKLAADFPRTPAPVIDRMLAELARLRLLLTGLRPPMTVTDALGHVADQLTAVHAAGIPQVADRVRQLRAIRDGISRHNRARSPGDRREDRARLAGQMRRSGGIAERPFTVDLLVDVRFGQEVLP